MTHAENEIADPSPKQKDPLSRLPKAGALLVFGAVWCAPFVLLKPVLADLKKSGTEVRLIDVDDWPHHAEQFRILSLPTFIWVREGQERRRLLGATSSAELHAFVSRK